MIRTRHQRVFDCIANSTWAQCGAFLPRKILVFAFAMSLVTMAGVSVPVRSESETSPQAKSLEAPPPIPGGGFSLPTSPVVKAANAGYLPGNLDVSPAGDTQYSIPLDVPPGPAGMQPSLALTYSSGAGNGILGMGWSVSGSMSAITRCGSTFATEGKKTGVHFLSSDTPEKDADRFCLGGEKLVAVSGPYGASNTEYRTEADSFAKIVSLDADGDGPNTFEVWSASGQLSEYTVQWAPRHEMNVDGAVGTELVRFAWLLTRQTDRSGNVIEYAYQIDEVKGQGTGFSEGIEIVPLRISYSTLNDSTLFPIGDRRRYVEFEYQRCDDPSAGCRTDASFSWQSGVRIENRRLLQSIAMYGPRPDATQLLRRYSFTYETGAHTGRNRLTSVRECGYLGGCLKAKEFTWTEDVPRFETKVIQSNVSLAFCLHKVRVDVVDFPCLSSPSSAWPESFTPSPIQPADFDGDGADDLIYEYGSTGAPPEQFIRLGEIQSSGYEIKPLARTHKLNAAAGYGNLPNDAYRVLEGSRPVDIDGDGQVELWAAKHLLDWDDPQDNSMGDFFFWNSNADAFAIGTSTGAFDYTQSWWRGAVDFTDFNGDGRLDATIYAPDDPSIPGEPDPRVFVNAGSLLSGPGVLRNAVAAPATESYVDVDGDGKTDYLSGFPGDVFLSLTDDSGGFANSEHFDGKYPIGPTYGVGVNELYYGDFNGDGLDDAALISWHQSPHIDIRWNTGNGFSRPLKFADLPTWTDVWNLSNKGLRLADLNGDGRSDFVFFHQSASSSPWGPGTDYAGITILYSSGGRTDLPDAATPMWGKVEGIVAVTSGDFRFSNLGDFNGDGRIDLVTLSGDASNVSLVVLQNEADATSTGLTPDTLLGQSDLLYQVKDESAAWPREEIAYSTKAGALRYQAGALFCGYPAACVRPGMSKVRLVTSRAHLLDPSPAEIANGGRVIEYSFETPIADLRGRGYQGFVQTRVWDEDRATETVKWYSRIQSTGGYYNPQPTRSRTTVVIDAAEDRHDGKTTARITESKNEYEIKTFNGDATYVVRPTTSVSETWEEPVGIAWPRLRPETESGNHIYKIDQSVYDNPSQAPQHVQTDLTYFDDNYGMPQTEHRHTRDGTDEQRSYTWEHRTTGGDWLIGLIKTIAVTQSGVPASVTRHREYDYDLLGRPSHAWVEKDNPDPDLRATTLIEYTGNGSPASVSEEAVVKGSLQTRTVRFSYDALFPGAPADERIFPSQVWMPRQFDAPIPSQWFAIHPGFGLATGELDVNGNQTVAVHDDLGRPVEAHPPGGKPILLGYEARADAAGGFNGLRLIATQESGPGINETQVAVLDGLGRSVQRSSKAFNGALVKTDYVYNKKGQLEATTRPYTGAAGTYFSSTAYDNLDRPLARWDAAGTLTQVYDYSFFETHITDAEGNQSFTIADHDGRIIESGNKVSGESITSHYSYGPFDVLRQITDAAGNVTQMHYDNWGRRTELDDPDRGIESTRYDGFGKIRQISHPASGSVISLDYDDLGRLLSRSSNEDGTDTFIWDTSPNGIGQLAGTMSAFGVATSHSYDLLGRPSEVEYTVEGETYRIDTTYESAYGRPDTLAYPSTQPGAPRFTVKNTYTSLGYLHQIQDVTQGAPATNFWTVAARDYAQSLTRGVLGNGVVVDWTYDAQLGRLTDITAEAPPQGGGSSPVLMGLNYGYYNNGLVRHRNDTVNDREEFFTYDSLSRLKDWTLTYGGATKTWTHTYDAIGNLKGVLPR